MSIYPNTLGHFLDAVFPRPPLQPPPWIVVAAEGGCRLVYWPPGLGPAPTVQEVAAWSPSNVTDVERLAQGVALYRAANEAAKEIILTLMVKVSGAMINLEVVNAASEPITADNANDEGARFVAYHREAIVDYKQAGRNQVAANALYAAVSSEGSLTAFPWLEASGGIILGIFASELGVTP